MTTKNKTPAEQTQARRTDHGPEFISAYPDLSMADLDRAQRAADARDLRERLVASSRRDASAVRRRLEKNSDTPKAKAENHPLTGVSSPTDNHPSPSKEKPSMAKTAAPVEKDTFVVQAKHEGSRAYEDAGAGKPSEEKARAFMAAVAAKHPSTSKFRLVKRTTTSSHVDQPLK